MTVPRIQCLSPELAGKIAAGEVVERPASVVKELVENSLDAGASQIVVELEQGGRELIRVVDNGCGLVPEDLPLAFARHATSKLTHEDDLHRIRSLGFRGEALAAIGSVAWVRIQSRTQDALVGAQLVCQGGQLGALEPWAGPAGTCVEVRQLFFNTPVRRKFLRSVSTELGQIVETVQRLALAFPGVHFRLSHHQRQVLEVPASWGYLERIQDFFGEEIAGRLLPVEYAIHQVRVQGWVGHPETARPSGRWQYFFVNQRYVRDRVLAHALQEAYRGYLMVGLQPVAFLFVELPPEAVDVNVHPTKIEVRFREQQTVYQAVLVAVRRALQQASLTPALSPASLVPAPRWTPAAPSASVGTLARPAAPPSHPAATSSDAELPPRRSGTLTQAPPVPDGVEADPATSPANSAAMTAPASVAAASSVAPAAAHEAKEPPSPPAPEATWFAAGQPVRAMQLHNTYLIVETPDGLLLVDQHALHERILYEQFQRQVLAGTLSQQTLLIPEPVDLTASQAALLLEHRAALEKVGLSVSEFGGSTVLVSAVPACWKRSAAELVQLAANYLAELDRVPEPNLFLDELLKRMACRSAVKAGDPLRPEEITFLLEHRHLLDNAHHCPHGRPTALFLSTQELERQFRRLG